MFYMFSSLETGSVCIDLGDEEDGFFDGSSITCPFDTPDGIDHKKGDVFLPGLKVTATITDVERAPRTHPFNPNL